MLWLNRGGSEWTSVGLGLNSVHITPLIFVSSFLVDECSQNTHQHSNLTLHCLSDHIWSSVVELHYGIEEFQRTVQLNKEYRQTFKKTGPEKGKRSYFNNIELCINISTINKIVYV